MKGTEKQIAWAEDIKRGMHAKADELVASHMANAKAKASADKYELYGGDSMFAQIGAILHDNIDSHEWASWYIDHRNCMQEQYVKAAETYAKSWHEQHDNK